VPPWDDTGAFARVFFLPGAADAILEKWVWQQQKAGKPAFLLMTPKSFFQAPVTVKVFKGRSASVLSSFVLGSHQP
jgi:hypothetical protein